MTRLIEIVDERHRVAIAPEVGAAIARADAMTREGPVPMLRGWHGGEPAPFAMGSNLLVPFSNRISGGGFSFEGRFHPLAPNLDGEPYPIHGDGFQAAWTVMDAGASAVTLSHDGTMGDLVYHAIVRYALSDTGLQTTLDIENRGAPLPFGGGFHPWFVRSPGTRLAFRAERVWTETEDHLPVDPVAVSELPHWDFSKGAPLPRGWINNAFTGWDGRARIIQPDAGISIAVEAGEGLDVAVVFSPAPDCGFFCFEPVSHAVDAHNQPGLPGLVTLATGETLRLSMRLGWTPLER